MMKRLTLIPLLTTLLMLFLLSPVTNAATIKATVDRNPIAINESFQLTFSSTESPDGDPDFAPLKKDFDILNQQQSNQTSFVNGKISHTLQWSLTLMAKKTGKLLIPSITFGSDISNPLFIEVKQSVAQSANRDIFLQVEASPKTPYVQSQVLYTVRFFRRVQIRQASLDDPEPENAVVEKLGEDKNYSTVINGINYSVIERQYAIFPQKSGPMTIPPVTLTAEVVRNRSSRFGFFGSQLTTTRRARSLPVTLEVKAKPASYTAAHWLPAQQVVLKEEWSNDKLTVNVGEPITRTLTLLAIGTTSSQLPELSAQPNNPALKSYPDKAVLKEQISEHGIIAFREEKTALIPSKPGDYVLPEIKVYWFNTQTNETEMVSLPEVTLHALAAKNSNVTTPPVAQTPAKAEQSTPQCPPEAELKTTDNSLIWKGLSLLLAVLWGLTLLYCLRFKKAPVEKTTPSLVNHVDDNINRLLKKACQANDPKAAKQALLKWGKQHFSANSLAAIAPHCEARLRDEINKLNQYLYAPQSDPWQGNALFRAFAEHNARKKVSQKQADSPLEPLYKN